MSFPLSIDPERNNFPPTPADPLVEAITREVESFDLIRVRVVIHLSGRERTILIDRDDLGPLRTELTWQATSPLHAHNQTVGHVELIGRRDGTPMQETFQALAQLVEQIEKRLLPSEPKRRAA